MLLSFISHGEEISKVVVTKRPICAGSGEESPVGLADPGKGFCVLYTCFLGGDHVVKNKVERQIIQLDARYWGFCVQCLFCVSIQVGRWK